MKVVDHDLDPDGDVILVLKNPNAPFAVWKDEDQWPCVFKSKPQPPNGTEDQPNDERDDAGSDAGQDIDVDQASQNDEPKEMRSEISEQLAEELKEIRMRLSSKHLTLASVYFKSMLKGPWQEVQSSENSPRLIIAEDWDEEALLRLMKTIHGYTRQVPRELDLERLAKMAVLVYYYQCHEAVEVFAESWLRVRPTRIYSSWKYGRDLVLQLVVSSVFHHQISMQHMIRIILDNSCGPLNNLDLPIPQDLVGGHTLTN